MARITENPKFIALGILLALGLGAYLYVPDLWKQINAPPKKPKMPAPPAKLSEDELRFYRMTPDRLPDKVGEILAPTEPTRTVFDEVPRRPKTVDEKREPPPVPEGWRLTSIFISPEQKAAVISGQAVMEGEILGPFTVAQIEPDQVVLRHPYGERVMNFSQFTPAKAASPSPTESSAKPPEAQMPAGLVPEAKEGAKAWERNQEAVEKQLEPAKPQYSQ